MDVWLFATVVDILDRDVIYKMFVVSDRARWKSLRFNSGHLFARR